MLNSIKKSLRPSIKEEEKVKKVAGELIERISKLVNAEVMLAGSIAKGTWIKGSHDIDIFVLFDRSEKDIDKKLISALSKEFKFDVVHGSRDYAKFIYKGFEVEVVPLYKLNSADEAENSIDASQFHIKYVKEHLDSKLADEVRLLKQFLKANGLDICNILFTLTTAFSTMWNFRPDSFTSFSSIFLRSDPCVAGTNITLESPPFLYLMSSS